MSPKSTAEERSKAAEQLKGAAIRGAERQIERDIARALKRRGTAERVKKAAKAALKAAPAIARVSAPLGALAAGAALYRGTVARCAKDRMKAIERKLGKLPKDAYDRLYQQHYDDCRRKATVRPSQGGVLR